MDAESTMTDVAVARDDAQYVTLGIDRDVFAVEVRNVREILDMRPMARLPNAPAFVMGMIDVRGLGVPVIDLRVKLGLPAVPPTDHTRILVLELDDGGQQRAIGLMADRVFEVVSLSEAELEPPPDVGVRWRSEYIRAVGRHDGRFVIVFNLEHLLTSEETALVEALT
jgi:purine-binding chemotaxis protein CheW